MWEEKERELWEIPGLKDEWTLPEWGGKAPLAARNSLSEGPQVGDNQVP